MSNYTKTTDFEAKDSLPTGDAEKIIRGADFETEFDNIATAIATKADTAGPTFTGIVTIPTAAVTTLSLDGTTVTSTAAEINLLDGVTATTAELNLLDGVTATTAELNILDGVTATAAELNTLDGITSTTAELNTLDGFTGTYEDLNFAQTLRASGVTGDEFDILDGLTATAAELNILDGATVTTAELNLLDGVTATTAELNILDGVTSTAAELNILDGVTSTAAELNLVDGSTAGTVVNSKAVVYGAAGEVNATTLQVGGVAITSTPAELNLLDGATVTTAEINILDGVTATTAELNLLDGVTATTAELNILDGVTATAAELNTLDGITSTTAELNILDGVTATAAELNTMDGITATTAELNILDGVTADATELNKLDGVTATTSELNYVDVTTLGVVEASKAVTADANADVLFGDNDKAIFGAGSDLQIYHDGSASYIDDQGTGNLKIKSNGVATQILDGSSLNLAVFNAGNGQAQLYNVNSGTSTIRLATTSTGIDVTGTVTADGLTVDGEAKISSTTPIIKMVETDTTDVNTLLAVSAGNFSVRTQNDAGTATTQRLAISNSTGDISFYEDTGTSPKMVWKSADERLGIGTDSPADTLSVVNLGSSGTGVQISSGTATGDLRFKARTESYNGILSVYDSGSNEDVRISAHSGVDTYFNSGSNVGIGTDSPARPLHVSTTNPVPLQLNHTDGTEVWEKFEHTGGNYYIGFTGTDFVLSPDTSARHLTVDTSGNLLVGKTATGLGNQGAELSATGQLKGTAANQVVAYLNRTSSDGTIAEFRKDNTTVGSIGTDSNSELFISGAGNRGGIGFYDHTSGAAIRPVNSDGTLSDGDTDLGYTDSRFKDLYLSGGAYLGGTGSANKLDDYEEGTWTVDVGGSTTAGTSSFTFRNGSYTKVGNIVTVTGYYRIASATGTGSLRITGLPFTAASGNGNYAVVTIGETINLAHTSGYTISGYVVPNTAELQITQIDYSGTNTSTSTLPIDGAHDLLFQCVYRGA